MRTARSLHFRAQIFELRAEQHQLSHRIDAASQHVIDAFQRRQERLILNLMAQKRRNKSTGIRDPIASARLVLYPSALSQNLQNRFRFLQPVENLNSLLRFKRAPPIRDECLERRNTHEELTQSAPRQGMKQRINHFQISGCRQRLHLFRLISRQHVHESFPFASPLRVLWVVFHGPSLSPIFEYSSERSWCGLSGHVNSDVPNASGARWHSMREVTNRMNKMRELLPRVSHSQRSVRRNVSAKLLNRKSGRRRSNPRRPAFETGRRLILKINRASRRLLSASKPL